MDLYGHLLRPVSSGSFHHRILDIVESELVILAATYHVSEPEDVHTLASTRLSLCRFNVF